VDPFFTHFTVVSTADAPQNKAATGPAPTDEAHKQRKKRKGKNVVFIVVKTEDIKKKEQVKILVNRSFKKVLLFSVWSQTNVRGLKPANSS